LKAHFPFAEIRKLHPLGFAFVCNRLIRFLVINLFVRRAQTFPGAFPSAISCGILNLGWSN
jgi:hypothetical protein